jgi:drug/metabolite transporter (DMT)-like permease
VSRKALILFAATSLIWGSSFLFIRVAAQDITPATVVFGRALLGAAILVPLALRARAFRGLGSKMLVVTVVTLLDMALPTFLTAWGEQHITSSVAGILTATDPLFTAVLLSALGYAASGLLYRRWLADAPALGVTALMTAISSAIFPGCSTL